MLKMSQRCMQHLILYDGTCGLCHFAVQWILKRDQKHIFAFAPLQGKTAKRFHQNPKGLETLILIENFQQPLLAKQFLYGKGALRILWDLGGRWTLLGWISFFPSFLSNWIYRFIAKRRFKWFERSPCLIPKKEDRERFFS